MTKSEQITCDASNLMEASQKVLSKSKDKSETKQFALHRLDEIYRAQNELHNRKWKITDKKSFLLHERGHTRKVKGNTPYDRMIIHSYIDNVLMPLLKSYLIYDNYSSQKKKGTDLARERFREFIHKAYREYGNNHFWILFGDFSKFYDNIRHDYLKNAIMKYIPDEEKDFNEYMIDTILDSFVVDVSWMTDAQFKNCLNEKYVALDHLYDRRNGERFMQKSLNIGNQASQLFSIFYPTQLDNYFKIVKSAKYYGRYMDDFICISNDLSFLHKCLEDTENISHDMGMYLNTKKTQIMRVDHSFKFLNRVYRLTESGHLIEKLSSETVTRERRKLKKFKNLLDENAMVYKKIENQFLSWKGNNRKFLSKKQLSSIDELYNKLFINDWGDEIAN